MTDEGRAVKRDTAVGMFWSLLATGSGRLVSLASLAVLARLLVPEDFGLLAFALVFLAYLETIGDLGTGMALIYWPERWRDVAQLTFVVNLAMGLFWFGVTLLVAPLVADFFGSPEGTSILRVLALTFPIKALGNTHDALLQRELKFRARLVPELALMVGKAVVAVALAFAGFGVWSLVWGQLVGQGLWTVAVWVLVRWRPTFTLPRDLVLPVFRYGRDIVAVNVLAAVVHHADLVVVGRMLGTVTLGFYQMAFRLPDVAVTLMVRVTSKVLFPAFSRLHAGGTELRDIYLSALRHLSLLTLPVAAVLVVLAEPTVLTVFGDQWGPSVPILRVLGVYAALRALGSYTGDLLKGTGKPQILAKIAALRAVVLVPALILGGTRDAVTVALALTAVTALTTLVNFWVAWLVVEFRVAALARTLWPGVAVAALVAGLVLGWEWIAAPLSPMLRFGGGAVIALLAYPAAVALLAPDVYRRLRTLVRDVRQGPRQQGSMAEVENGT